MKLNKFIVSYSPSSIRDSHGFFNDIDEEVVYASTSRQAAKAFKEANPTYSVIQVKDA